MNSAPTSGSGKPIWVKPWGYAEGWFICLALLITGFFPCSSPSADWTRRRFSWPLNAYLGGRNYALVGGVVVVCAKFGNRPLAGQGPGGHYLHRPDYFFWYSLMGFTLQGSQGKSGLGSETRSKPHDPLMAVSVWNRLF